MYFSVVFLEDRNPAKKFIHFLSRVVVGFQKKPSSSLGYHPSLLCHLTCPEKAWFRPSQKSEDIIKCRNAIKIDIIYISMLLLCNSCLFVCLGVGRLNESDPMRNGNSFIF